MHGTKTHGNGKYGPPGRVKKPTGFLTSSWHIVEAVGKLPDGSHEHVQFLGGRARGAAIYPKGLCDTICKANRRQTDDDRTNLVTSIGLDKDAHKKVLFSLASKILHPGSTHAM